jgi:hypothetical protein
MQGSSRPLAGFRSRCLLRGWLFPSCGGRFSLFRRDRLSRFGYGCMSRFGHGFNRSWQFRPGRFRSAMAAMVQRLDARSFFFFPHQSVYIFSALVLEIFRNRFSCHDRSVAELSRPSLSNFGHSVTNHGSPRQWPWMNCVDRRLTGVVRAAVNLVAGIPDTPPLLEKKASH